MTIRDKLFLNSFLIGASVVLIFSITFWQVKKVSDTHHQTNFLYSKKSYFEELNSKIVEKVSLAERGILNGDSESLELIGPDLIIIKYFDDMEKLFSSEELKEFKKIKSSYEDFEKKLIILKREYLSKRQKEAKTEFKKLIENEVYQDLSPRMIGYLEGNKSELEKNQKKLSLAIRNLTLIVTIFVLAMLTFSSFISYIISQSIKTGLLEVLKGIDLFSKGDLKKRIEVKSGDEFSIMAVAFNNMANSLDDSTQHLTQTKKYLDNIMNSMADALLVLNNQGLISKVNPSLLMLSGYLEEELIHKPFSLLLEKEKVENNFDLLEQIRRERVHDLNYFLKNKVDERKYILLSGSTMKDEKNQISAYVCVAKDITNSKKLQEELEDQRSKSVSSSKMATLGEMAAGIAHEINNPLAIIQGNSALALKIMNSENKDLSKLEKILLTQEKAVTRITKIIKGLRSFSRDGSRDPFLKVAVKSIIEEMMELSQSRFKNQGLNIEINTFSETLSIECRAVEVSQVLLNLLNNSLHATEKLSEKWVKLEILDLGNEVQFSVTDSGFGIPMEVQQKMFNPFFTTKEIGKGTGLGLSISKGIIESHGGKLWINNQSKNTCFMILLPKLQVDSEARLVA